MSDQPPEDLYELRTTSTVRPALGEVLPEAVAAAAYEFITGPLLREPYRVGKRLLPPMDDRFSARRGTYRIIYRIDDKNRIVTVVDVDHRRDVYRTQSHDSLVAEYPLVLLSRRSLRRRRRTRARLYAAAPRVGG